MRWIERLLDRKTSLQSHEWAARDWKTCAVGEVVNDFPSVVLVKGLGNGEPVDDRLRNLGVAFPRYIRSGQRRKALETYDAIQTRVRTLLRKASA